MKIFFVCLLSFLVISQTAVLAKSNSSGSSKYFTDSIKQIDTVKEKTKNPEVKAALDKVKTTQLESEKVIDNSLQKISTRSGLKKLIIGPDYKNVGQVRSEIVHLQNETRQLIRLESTVPVSEKPALQQSIAALKSELNGIEASLNTSLQGFSLFGWLTKLFTNVTPVVTPTPTAAPTVVPTIVPTVVPTTAL